jgi:hypothetical protein
MIRKTLAAVATAGLLAFSMGTFAAPANAAYVPPDYHGPLCGPWGQRHPCYASQYYQHWVWWHRHHHHHDDYSQY